MITQDSAKFWFPKLTAPGPSSWLRSEIPNTVFVDYNEGALVESLQGKPTDEYERLYYAVETALRFEVGSPAFIRGAVKPRPSGRGYKAPYTQCRP